VALDDHWKFRFYVEEVKKWKKWKGKRAGSPEEKPALFLSAAFIGARHASPVHVSQKSICALNFTNRGCRVDCGASQFADGLVVLIVGLNAWL
jgi:hypothetical protein